MDYNYDAYKDTYDDPEVAYKQVSSALMMLSEGINKSQDQMCIRDRDYGTKVFQSSALDAFPIRKMCIRDRINSFYFVGCAIDGMGDGYCRQKIETTVA